MLLKKLLLSCSLLSLCATEVMAVHDNDDSVGSTAALTSRQKSYRLPGPADSAAVSVPTRSHGWLDEMCQNWSNLFGFEMDAEFQSYGAQAATSQDLLSDLLNPHPKSCICKI